MPAVPTSPLRRRLVALAWVVALAPALWWGAAGARRGFWQDRVAVTATDAVTGLTVQEWRPQFVPGIETPLAGLLVAGVLLGLSRFWKPRHSP